MAVDAIQLAQATGATTTSKSGSPTAGAGTLDYSAFLQLLIAQMEHQDPLKPTSSTEYVAQLASFSEVEQSVKTNEMVSAMMTSSRITEANALVGREISSADGFIRGIVESVRVGETQSIAMLSGGNEIPLTQNIVVYRGENSE